MYGDILDVDHQSDGSHTLCAKMIASAPVAAFSTIISAKQRKSSTTFQCFLLPGLLELCLIQLYGFARAAARGPFHLVGCALNVDGYGLVTIWNG